MICRENEPSLNEVLSERDGYLRELIDEREMHFGWFSTDCLVPCVSRIPPSKELVAMVIANERRRLKHSNRSLVKKFGGDHGGENGGKIATA
jgi:hypothetical protein